MSICTLLTVISGLGASLLGIWLGWLMKQNSTSDFSDELIKQRNALEKLEARYRRLENESNVKISFHELSSRDWENKYLAIQAKLNAMVELGATVPQEMVKEIRAVQEIERVVEKEKIVPVEVIKEVVVEVVKEVEVIKEVELIKEVPVEIVKEVEVIKEVEVVREVPVEIIKESPAKSAQATNNSKSFNSHKIPNKKNNGLKTYKQ